MTENWLLFAAVCAWLAVQLAAITVRARQAARRDAARAAKAGTP
jgi:hypothetical protein